MRRPLRIPTALVVTLTLAVSIFWATGCSRDESSITGPKYDAIATGLRADDPAVMAAMVAQDRATPALLKQSGILGTGVSADAAGKPVILVYTERAGMAGVPKSIDGIPTQEFVTGKVVAYAKPGGGTLQMGTSTGNDNECASGTLSCVVIKGGTEYFLSNNHVFARENAASIGERIDAPGRYDGHPRCAQTPIAATLSDFQPINFGGNNTIDAAIARPDPGRAYTSVSAGGYDPSSTVVSPSVGLAVKKQGRTSGLTHATIQAINVTITVGYSAGTAVFNNQIQTPGQFIRAGDSGSLMVTETGANPVGLCFAGSSSASFSNPIGPVLQRFSATVK